MNIRNSMYRMVFGLIVIPFLFFSLLISHIYSKRMEAVIADSLHVVANTQVAEMTNFCEQQKEALTLIGMMDMSRAAMRRELSEETEKFLNNVLASRTQIMSYMMTITVLDKDYRIVASSNEDYGLFADEGIEKLTEKLEDRDFYISDILVDKQGQNTLAAVSKIEDDGELLGYALAEIDINFYKNIRENAELWEASTFYLLDGRKQIISAGTPDENRESFITTDRERSDYRRKYDAIDFDENPQGSFQYRVGGRDYITYYSDVNYTDWQILLSVGMDSYYAKRTVFYVLAFFMILLCSAVAVWIGRFASKRIVHPISCISGTLQEIRQEQNYSLRVEIRRKDELGALAEEVDELLGFIETENLYKIQQQRLLQQKAGQDALTKVMNKERIGQYLKEAIETHRTGHTPMALLFVDVDDFKAFNTNYGHGVGDEVLLFLTAILKRELDSTVGRVGGDEFLAVVETPEYVRDLDRYLGQFEKTAANKFIVRGTGGQLPVSCCIGAVRIDFSAYEVPEITAAILINLADQGMYQVKNNGKSGHMILEYEPHVESER